MNNEKTLHNWVEIDTKNLSLSLTGIYVKLKKIHYIQTVVMFAKRKKNAFLGGGHSNFKLFFTSLKIPGPYPIHVYII